MRINTKSKIVLYEISIAILLIILYKYPLSQIYSYTGFVSTEFDYYKLLVSSMSMIFFIFLGQLLKNNIYYFVYNTYIIMYTIPGLVLYIFAGTSFYPNILINIPIIIFIFIDFISLKSKLSMKNMKLSKRKVIYIFVLIGVLLLPFMKNIGSINFKNLLFIDIYETRLDFRATNSSIAAYLMSPLSRFLLPLLAIYGFKQKNKIVLLLATFSIMLVYLTSGALKSLLFSFAFILFFALKNDIYSKVQLFLKFFNLGLIFELSYYFLTGKELFTTYIRRAIFVGPLLFDQYYNYFKDDFIFYKHTRVLSLLTGDYSYRGITLWFGENVIGKQDLNASVGSLVEGYISMGVLGVILASLLVVFFCIFYSSLKIENAYIGMLFTMIMLFNGSFVEPLLVTHGGILFVIMLIYIIPKDSKRLNNNDHYS